PKRASSVKPGVPSDFDHLIARCLEKDPIRRFSSIGEVRTALKNATAAGEAHASIAVLPFANLSADKENEYFGDGLAEEIINALRDRLGAPVHKRIAPRQAVNIEAYHLYVEGRHYFYKFTPDGMDRGQRLFEEALAVDPSYALPLVELAHCFFINTMSRRVSP